MSGKKKISQTLKAKKKSFSSFNKSEAYKQLHLTDLLLWQVEIPSIPATEFFQQRLARLRYFDLQDYERSRELLIDAICEEGIQGCDRLKIWKGASLESDVLIGEVDYLVAERKGYLEAPILCAVEAKKDDFEQGLAQCLVEMQACQWSNQQLGKQIDVMGIVTNGEGWKFYQLTKTGEVYESLLHALGDLEVVLGWLRYIFKRCEHNLINSEVNRL